jgi:hypothetical protein
VTPRSHPDDVLLASEATTLAFWPSTGAAIELLERDDAQSAARFSARADSLTDIRRNA